jgi:membrane fusion protein, multidrug efflux system
LDANDAKTQAGHLGDRLATERTFDRIPLISGRDGLAMRLARATGIAVVGVLIVGSVLFWRFELRNPTSKAQQSEIPVTAGIAKAKDVPIFTEGLGTVQAFNMVTVKTRVDGAIIKVFFKEGQEVKAGDPLFQIDPRPYHAALQLAQASLGKDEAVLANAKIDLARYEKLTATNAINEQQFDTQKALVAQDTAQVQADQATIENAQLNLDYALIRSPIDGRTGQRFVDVGNYVQAAQNSSLVTITQIRPIFVSFNVPADQLDEIRKNQAQHPLKVIAYAMDDKTVLTDGNLTLIDNQVDTTTDTIHLKAEFTNANEPLWPGQGVSVHLILSTRRNAITVPAQTVMQGPNGPYIYILGQDDIAKRQNVEVAVTQEGLAVITKGLAADQRVVVDGQYRLTDGSKVKLNAPQAASVDPQAGK